MINQRFAHPSKPLRPLCSPVTDDIWERIRQVTIDLVLERGQGPVPAADIITGAGVSEADFESRFTGARDCWDRVYEANLADLDQALFGAYLTAPSWRQGLGAGVSSAVAYLRDHWRERRYEEILICCGGPMEQATRDLYLQRLVDLVDAGREESAAPHLLSRGTAEVVVGSIQHLLLSRFRETPDAIAGPQLLAELIYMVVRPYLGHEEAVRAMQLSRRPHSWMGASAPGWAFRSWQRA